MRVRHLCYEDLLRYASLGEITKVNYSKDPYEVVTGCYAQVHTCRYVSTLEEAQKVRESLPSPVENFKKQFEGKAWDFTRKHRKDWSWRADEAKAEEFYQQIMA